MTWVQNISKSIDSAADPAQADVLRRFFKTGKGEYCEGDKFLGVKVPPLRKICREYADEFATELSKSPQSAMEGISKLLCNGYHEYREAALFLLAHACEQSRNKKPKVSAEAEEAIFNFYLANTEYINNWDLVDCSAPCIVGAHILDRPRDILYTPASSRWSIVSACG